MRRAGGASLVVVIVLAMMGSLWAADGWYLLIPPLSEYDERAKVLSGYKILDNKPLSQWAHQGAYDSASECEAMRKNLTMVSQRVYLMSSEEYSKALRAGTDPFMLKNWRESVESHNAEVRMFMASRCIRSDDPRLGR